jgi:hypothetical protein
MEAGGFGSGGDSSGMCAEVWRRSTFSGAGGGGINNCVEVALTSSPVVAVRDSKHPASVIHVPSSSWDFLLRDLS